jgi:class 3 adenylate cyclase
MMKIREEFLQYAPAYAIEEAREALDKIADLRAQRMLQEGVYYIVLVDLVGSTKFTAEHGNEKSAERIQQFISSTFRALNDAALKSVGIFVKEIGDAALFIFQHFPDVIRWHAALADHLAIFERTVFGAIVVRTCVHVGEVGLIGVNPLSLAVSQVFKMEKSVQGGDIVLTDPAFHIAWPTVARAYHGFKDYGEVELDGFKKPVALHQLLVNDGEDLKRMLEEEID